ncbi:O-methyltransferase [Kitasatospora xanthocidica]|uniref:methyltransferase domain-containing protein n=1 Tax=Kitasatospora xanthocidica TaxID=83382 RepID=UPI001679D666|nr:methyltransferase domain-containing protein [Kitasatospora xanthocidica]GHF30282.1 O-methyltransferase [Kitasatospora xanthocidica]
MTTVLHSDQQVLRARADLATEVERAGSALSARVVDAFLTVPRHPFVPVFYREESGLHLPWREEDFADDSWLAEVYADRALITEVDGVHAEDAAPGGFRGGIATSSATLPSLLAEMLDALDVRPGSRVLELGTGTGYTAALLCHLAGSATVTTADRTGQLVDNARTRLYDNGFEPTVVRAEAADGSDGHPAGAPYDRIIATRGVRRIPRAWLDQCAPGGLIVAPVRGAVARLTKLADGRAVGRFLPRNPGEARATEATDSRVLDDPAFSFWAALHPQDLQAAHTSWLAHHRPRREWFTLEAGPGAQHITHTTPDGTTLTWAL